MIKQTAPTNHTSETDKLKNELVQETLQSLSMNKDNRFNLSTEEGIHQVVDYLVDFHVQQKIANGEILIFKSRQTTSVSNGGDV
jgi:hypothetical protein